MSAHTIKLSDTLEAELENLVAKTGFSRSHLLAEAFESYVRNHKILVRSTAIREKIASGEIRVKSLNNINVVAKHDLAG